MKVVVAIDSFKGSLSSIEAGNAVKDAILFLENSAEVVVRPLADGGEGRLDSQTVMGKAPIGVAALAKKYGKKVIGFSGCVTEDAEACNEHGIDVFFPIVRGVTTLEDALKKENAYKNLTATARQVFRLIFMK